MSSRISNAAFRIIVGLMIAGSLWLVACSGDTGGSDENFDGTSFSDTDSAAGSIRLEVNETDLGVADSIGFHVYVRDANSAPVSGIEIACDTETGLALLEPTSGFELTDSNGQMSGRVGCVSPGSYQIGCRLPVGGNKRSFETVRCSGPVPAGFSGFPGSGGGTLGVGGGTTTGGAIPNATNGQLQLSGVTIAENGSDTVSIDVRQGTCGTTTLTAEPFTDTLVRFKVSNATSELVNFGSFSYKVSNASGGGTFFESTELALTAGGDVAANGSADLTGLFLKAGSGGKTFTGSGAQISTGLGFRNVTFTLFGTTSSGQSTQVQATVGLSFGNFDKCTTSS